MQHLVLWLLTAAFCVLLVWQFVGRKGDRGHVLRAIPIALVMASLLVPVIDLFRAGEIKWNMWLALHLPFSVPMAVVTLAAFWWGFDAKFLHPFPQFLGMDHVGEYNRALYKNHQVLAKHRKAVRWIKRLAAPTLLTAALMFWMS